MSTSPDCPDTKDWNKTYKTMKEQFNRVGVKENRYKNRQLC